VSSARAQPSLRVAYLSHSSLRSECYRILLTVLNFIFLKTHALWIFILDINGVRATLGGRRELARLPTACGGFDLRSIADHCGIAPFFSATQILQSDGNTLVDAVRVFCIREEGRRVGQPRWLDASLRLRARGARKALLAPLRLG
jgi:hypothetical protein